MERKETIKWSILQVVVLFTMTFASQSSHAAATRIRTVTAPSGGQAMSAKTDEQGIIHLAYSSPDGPQYASSRDDGKTWSKPISLVDRESRKPGLEFIIWDMAVTPEGVAHIALGNNAWKLKLPQEEWGYFYTRLLKEGKTFTPLHNVNRKPSEGFSLAVGPDGLVTAVWMADKLYANVSRDGGSTFSEAVDIDSRLNPCNCCTTSSIYGSDRKLAILYREETDNERDMYLALWDQDMNTVTKTRVSTTPWKIDSCPMTYYSITRDGDGFVAAWPTKGEIYFARFGSDGKPRKPDEIKTAGSNGMRTGLVPIATADGGTLVAWKKDNQINWQVYDERGRPTGAPGSASSAGNGVAAVRAKNGELIIVR